MTDISGPAFPIVEPNTPCAISTGMTLRDYFAAKAMQSFAADPEASWRNGLKGMADQSYLWADAMLEARGEPK